MVKKYLTTGQGDGSGVSFPLSSRKGTQEVREGPRGHVHFSVGVFESPLTSGMRHREMDPVDGAC